MKITLNPMNRIRVVLGVATMALLPLGSSFNTAEAKPPSHAPAYGYRRKNDDNRWDRKRDNRWDRNRNSRWDRKRDSRWDRNRDNRWDRNRNNYRRTDSRWKDDYYDSHYRNGQVRPYVTRYRTVRLRNGHTIHQPYRVLLR